MTRNKTTKSWATNVDMKATSDGGSGLKIMEKCFFDKKFTFWKKSDISPKKKQQI